MIPSGQLPSASIRVGGQSKVEDHLEGAAYAPGPRRSWNPQVLCPGALIRTGGHWMVDIHFEDAAAAPGQL